MNPDLICLPDPSEVQVAVMTKCNNNCKGGKDVGKQENDLILNIFSSVRAFGIVGGGAALAFLGATGAVQTIFTPLVGTAGLLGLGLAGWWS